MSNTYSQINIQIVFTVRNREALIQSAWEDQLYKYITGIVQMKKQKMLAINGMPDHLHLLIGINPACCISELVREIKKSSTQFINENKLCTYKFTWQEGYGAFSYSRSQIPNVYAYIQNQKQHHKKYTFKEEYISFLNKYEVEYDLKYLFEWI
jgi:putative transposase